jgi:small-conductance mechanosensitive channel
MNFSARGIFEKLRSPMTLPGLRHWRCAVIGGWLGATLAAFGQLATTNAPDDPAGLAAQLQLRLAGAQAELNTLAADTNTPAPLPSGATADEATDYQLTAASLVRTYQNHIDELAHWQEAQRQQQEQAELANAWRGFTTPAPYSILLVDELRDSVQSLTVNLAASGTSLDVLQAISQDAAAALKKSDEHLRQLTEQLESEKNVLQVTRLTWLREWEEIHNRLDSASAALNETRRLKVAAELRGQQQQLAFVRRKLAIASQQVRFSGADLEQKLAHLEIERQQIQKEIALADAELGERQRALAAVREELQSAVAPPGLTPTPTNRIAPSARLQAVAELRRAQVETSLQKQTLLRRLADMVVSERGLWQMRFASFDTRDLTRIREGYQRLDHLERLIRIVRPYFLQQLDLAASLIAEQRNQTGTPPEIAAEMQNCLQQREELAQRGVHALNNLDRLVARWQESLDQERSHLPVITRVRDLFSEASSFATKFWHFELFAATDSITVDGQTITGRRSVTVGKIALALIILTVGYWLALRLSRLLERLAVKRFKVEPNQAGLIRRWVEVVLILALVIFSLVSVKIPLTIFAFLGGALAIGFGFGMQNLLKNFVSGIIILFERPFRVGDVLDIEDHRGTVLSIGIRSSVVKFYDGTETLIPNSALLENNLTNWTYSDRQVRFSLTVGIAYGTDTRRAAKLLTEVAERHGLVQKTPVPQVLFQEFGDSALTFELRYWVDVHQHNASQIGSDLRHMIASTFAENGIVMAFPQRDLHLDTTRPLQIEIMPEKKPAAPARPGKGDPN